MRRVSVTIPARELRAGDEYDGRVIYCRRIIEGVVEAISLGGPSDWVAKWSDPDERIEVVRDLEA